MNNISDVIIICNILCEKQKNIRNVTTDSAAAKNKILSMCKSLENNFNPVIVSLGRGSPGYKFNYFPTTKSNINNYEIHYAAYTNNFLFSYFLSLFSLVFLLLSLHKRKSKKTVVFYNRQPLYILCLFISKLLGYNCILDLEDAELNNVNSHFNFRFYVNSLFKWAFDIMCTKVILAAKGLTEFCSISDSFCFYGHVDNSKPTYSNDGVNEINILFSGYIDKDSGLNVIIDLISNYEIYSDIPVTIHVTGNGPGLIFLKHLYNNKYKSKIYNNSINLIVYNFLSIEDYKALIDKCNVGLCLKLSNGIYSTTTFPSKVVEYTKNGLCLICTDLQDVVYLYQDSLLVLEKNNELNCLINILKKLSKDIESINYSARLQFNFLSKKLFIDKVQSDFYNFVVKK